MSAAPALVSAASGTDNLNGSTVDGNPVGIWTCNSGTNQQWASGSDGRLTSFGRCLDAFGHGTTPGTDVTTWSCNGGANQRWALQSDGPSAAPGPGSAWAWSERPRPTAPAPSSRPATEAPAGAGPAADVDSHVDTCRTLPRPLPRSGRAQRRCRGNPLPCHFEPGVIHARPAAIAEQGQIPTSRASPQSGRPPRCGGSGRGDGRRRRPRRRDAYRSGEQRNRTHVGGRHRDVTHGHSGLLTP
ncbi:ricin-type beta-trefoil lectin domain protein [Streptomyces sp. NPDC059352]|uniref:ricin-type beta-trefoil lectin domain protein n=1 Tax=Streptomyces sp. NPDC059352 TaxID=3346810 RepID=UPI00367EA75E